MMKPLTLSLLSVTSLLLFSGCSVKETTQKPYSYTLDPKPTLERFATPNRDVLKIARVDATSGLNNRAIVYVKDGAMQPYKYGVWSETPPLKLQHLLTEALQDQNHFASVISGTSMASNNLILEPTLQHFEEVFRDNGSSYVHVVLRVRLIELKTGVVLGSTKLSTQEEISNTQGAQGVVEAFNAATAKTIKELSIWLNAVR